MPRMGKRNAAAESSTAKYRPMTRVDNGFIDSQFIKPPTKVPYKAILLAITLFVFGTILIVVGALLLSGHIDTKQTPHWGASPSKPTILSINNVKLSSLYSDRTWPVLIIGLLMFIPGSYHVHLAYSAWAGRDGYSFEDIPEFD